MSERSKFEKWLGDLEAKKASTPPHVFDRVKADYTLRLDGVLDKLREHTAEMREHSENLAKKLEELEDAEQNLLDEKAENALRAEVGELSESEWESFSRKAEKTLAKLQEDQEVIAADLERIRDLLGSVEGKPKSPPAPAAAASDGGSKQGMDELEFLKSVVGTTPTRSPGPGQGGKPAQAPADAKPEPPAQAPKPAAAAAPATSPTPTPIAAAAPIPQPKPESIIAKPVTGPVIQPKAPPEPPSGPLGLRATGSQDIPKTLKCAECGAMNYPSEWYCERCGAELANI